MIGQSCCTFTFCVTPFASIWKLVWARHKRNLQRWHCSKLRKEKATTTSVAYPKLQILISFQGHREGGCPNHCSQGQIMKVMIGQSCCTFTFCVTPFASIWKLVWARHKRNLQRWHCSKLRKEKATTTSVAYPKLQILISYHTNKTPSAVGELLLEQSILIELPSGMPQAQDMRGHLGTTLHELPRPSR